MAWIVGYDRILRVVIADGWCSYYVASFSFAVERACYILESIMRFALSVGAPSLALCVASFLSLLFLLFRSAVFSVTKPKSSFYRVSAPTLLARSETVSVERYSSSPNVALCHASKSSDTRLYDDDCDSHGSGTIGMCLEIGSYETNQYNAIKKISIMILSAIIPHLPWS